MSLSKPNVKTEVTKNGKTYVSLAEAARRLGVSRQRASQLFMSFPTEDVVPVGARNFVSVDWVEAMQPAREEFRARTTEVPVMVEVEQD
jgi:hypothetical protein